MSSFLHVTTCTVRCNLHGIRTGTCVRMFHPKFRRAFHPFHTAQGSRSISNPILSPLPAPLPHRTSIIHGPNTYTFLHHHQDEARFTRSPIIATLNAANPSATFAAARFNLLLRSSSRAARYAASSSAFRLLPATTPARNTRACVVARILIDEEDDDDSGCGDDSGMVLCHDQNNAM